MKEFINILLGQQPLVNFLALVFFALLGAALSLLLQASNRNPNSDTSPLHFSWTFFFSDNAKRIVAGVILIFIALRFTPELFGVDVNAFWALVIGFTNDKIAQILKDKTNILGSKPIA